MVPVVSSETFNTQYCSVVGNYSGFILGVCDVSLFIIFEETDPLSTKH